MGKTLSKLFTAPRNTLLLLSALALNACGEGPPEYIPGAPVTTTTTSMTKGSTSSAGALNSSTSTSDPAAGTPSGSQDQVIAVPSENNTESTKPANPTPGANPAAQRLAIRTLPNAAERQSMTTLYAATAAQGGCADCHGALAASTRRGRTAAQIVGAMNLIQHNQVRAANRWPRDTVDTTDDGVDGAQLFASALADILK